MTKPTNIDQVEEFFPGDVANHSMDIIQDEGVFRHLVFSENGLANMMFGIVTWPMHLCIYGDMGTFVFRRCHDMFTFFRGNRINPRYWQEKIQDGWRRAEEFDFEATKAGLAETLKEYEENIDVDDIDTWRDDVKFFLNYLEHEEMACTADIRDFNSCDFEFDCVEEYMCYQFTYHYLWLCKAIVKGIDMYDKEKA